MQRRLRAQGRGETTARARVPERHALCFFPVSPFGGTLAQSPQCARARRNRFPSRPLGTRPQIPAYLPSLRPGASSALKLRAEVGRGWGTFLKAPAGGFWAAATVYLLTQTGEGWFCTLGSGAPVMKPGTWARKAAAQKCWRRGGLPDAGRVHGVRAGAAGRPKSTGCRRWHCAITPRWFWPRLL